MKKISMILFSAVFMMTSVLSAFASGLDNVFVLLGNDYVQSDDVYVEITSPSGNSTVYSGYTMTVEASVEASDTVESVQFYKNNESTPFDTVSNAPYQTQVVCEESFTVKAKAFTNGGYYNESAAQHVTVEANTAPQDITYANATFDESLAVPAGMNLDAKSETSTIVATPADNQGNTRSGNSAYMAISSANKGAPWIDYYNPATPLAGKVVVETSVMSTVDNWTYTKPDNSVTTQQKWFQIFSEGLEAQSLMEFNGKNINSFYEVGGKVTSNKIVVGSLAANKWYDFKFVIDFDALTYTVDVDGINYGGVLTLPGATNATSLERYQTANRIRNRIGLPNTGVYMDYFKVYSQPKQSVISLNNISFGSTATPADISLNSISSSSTAAVVANSYDTKTGYSAYLASYTKAGDAPYVEAILPGSGASGVVTLEANLMMQTDNYPSLVELFYLTAADPANPATTFQGRLAKLDKTNLNAFNGGNTVGTVIANFEKDHWYKLKYVLNTKTRTYAMYLGDNPVAGMENVKLNIGNDTIGIGNLQKVRFRLAYNNDTKNSLYVDDIKISVLAAPALGGVVFTSNSGLHSMNQAKVPSDLRSISVAFDEGMNAATFSGVTLTNKATSESIGMTGAYNANSKQFTASLEPNAQLVNGQTYVLSFPADVSSSAGASITAQTIEFTANDYQLTVNGVEFKGADGNTLVKTSTGGSVKAQVSVTNNTDDSQDFIIVIAKYADNKLEVCHIKTVSSMAANTSETFENTLSELANDISSSDIRVYVWRSLNNIWPVSGVYEAE